MAKFKLPATAIRFHRDDPKTDKTDPGIKITKNRFLKLLRSFP
jgi:hypothetical protein